ncbi:MAG: Endonuclease III [candidate division TM6 bacterium GW2011_GWF2_32_72]|nr:MAG: Endonuclease III [candidate division TM6 bacterium GW2011_GWF2_32_72]
MNKKISELLQILERFTKDMPKPLTDIVIKEFGHSPFLILISCLLSLRARDVVTIKIVRKLFKRAQTPQEIIKIPILELEEIIKPIGFYHTKARVLQAVSKEILEEFDGLVPDSEEKLLKIKGVGRKTAALVLSQAFNKPAICVDVHVHRISNRLGLVKTKTPEQTEKALKKVIPQEKWLEINRLLVIWGQNICTPISPFCSKCPLKLKICPQIGVKTTR